MLMLHLVNIISLGVACVVSGNELAYVESRYFLVAYLFCMFYGLLHEQLNSTCVFQLVFTRNTIGVYSDRHIYCIIANFCFPIVLVLAVVGRCAVCVVGLKHLRDNDAAMLAIAIAASRAAV